MQFIFEQLRTGGDRNFGYLIGDRSAKCAALIDPSYQPESLVDRAKEQGLDIELIINTHSHGDHTNGNSTAKELTKADIAAYKGSYVKPDKELEDGQKLKLGNIELVIFHTPGHCDDHIVIYIPKYFVAITGDHLFVGKVGGTSGKENARQQYDSLLKLYKVMPDKTTIWPGHDYGCRPVSTLEIEKECNPFLQCENFEAFCDLKQSWPSFKSEFGLR